ncbi:DUF3828 domain-containing protein [Roseomonas eburnea]|uniref:DUF3828 domain-containing protein n=1 Tax=Neoroseomonas eburnea TaxID=1346889 RepID=A0A9X9XD18_9PROT|nr:DUF3828 domain-containing protein [Neoroseomonas eburnea]MBR0681604.1 DUF3828 domain-containing protein [Neoroseomonas eburnea]
MTMRSPTRRAVLSCLVIMSGTASRAAAQAPADPQAFVAELYRAHMPSVTGSARGVVHDPRLRARFFAPDLAAAIGRDFREADRTGEVATLMMDPITASQDPEVRNLSLHTVARDGDSARVEARFRQRGGTTRVLFLLRRGRSGWAIWDIGWNGRPPELRSLYGLP